MSSFSYFISSTIAEDVVEDSHLIHIVREPATASLGIGIIGGNTIGIFVSEIKAESLAFLQPGLKCGDQILEVSFLYIFVTRKCR